MKKVTVVSTYVLLLETFVILTQGAAQLANSPWPMLRHDPQRTGCNALNKGPSSPVIAWTFKKSPYLDIYSKPIIGLQQELYLGTGDNYLTCLNSNGVLEWNYKLHYDYDVWLSPTLGVNNFLYITQGEYLDCVHTVARSSNWHAIFSDVIRCDPLLDNNGHIFILPHDNNLYCYNSSNESMRWSYAFTEHQYSFLSLDLDSNVYVPDNREHRLNSFSNDGMFRWSYLTEGNYSTCIVGKNNTIYGAVCSSGAYYISAWNALGNVQWSYIFHDTLVAPGLDNNGNIYFGSDDYNIYSLNSIGGFRWSYSTAYKVNGEPTIDSLDRVYISSEDRRLYSLYSTGSLCWSYEFQYQVSLHGAVIPCDDRLYCLSPQDHTLYCLTNPTILPTQTYTNTPTATPTFRKNATVTPTPTTLLGVFPSDSRVKPNKPFSFQVDIPPLSTLVDAWCIIIDPLGRAYSLTLKEGIISGLKPMVRAVTFSEGFSGSFNLHIPLQVLIGEYKLIIGLVRTGAFPSSIKDAISGYIAQKSIFIEG